MRFLNIFFFLFISIIGFVSCKNEKEITLSETKQTNETVTPLANPTFGNTALPRLFAASDHLFMSWVEKRDTLSVLYYSSLKNGKWAKPFEVNSGEDWFINWADFPVIAENNGAILISYLQKSANGKYTYDIKLNLFSAETQTWKKNIILHNDGTASEHGFVAVVPNGKSSFYAIWLDGRNTTGGHDSHKSHDAGAMTLRGRLVHADGTMQPDVALDARVCDCCQTAMTTINDAPVLVYRDRSADEIRDISLIGLFDDSFSASKTVHADNWKLPGCPVNGPAIASYENNIAVAWFTAANDNPRVQLAFSTDKGKTFGAPIQINSSETLGRVAVAMVSKTTAIISWMETIGEETLIQAMRVSLDGTKGFPVTISKTSFERSSGFPQLAVVENKIYAAWTMVEGDKSTIKTASFSVEAL
ncbi:hypothetical protein [Aequorivita sp. Q41]|uniref:hypothetical protein n=1 Tax=Aequorivita sp. Q41 TaxID=3153300 RepID=UPI00324223F5